MPTALAMYASGAVFAANITAGLMLEQFSRWLGKLLFDRDLQLDLLASGR